MKKYALKLSSEASVEPITLTEAKDYLKLETTSDDSLVTQLIKAVRQVAQDYLSSSLITQSWEISYDDYAPSEVKLLMGPVQSVTSVKMVAKDGSETVIADDLYYLNAAKDKLILQTSLISHRIEIIYVSGYGDAASDVPAAIKQAMLAHLEEVYDGRSAATAMPKVVKSLYFPYKLRVI